MEAPNGGKPFSQEKPSPDQTQLSLPLVVDLDGTLVRTDLLIESLFALIRQNPFYVFLLPYWLLRGKAFLKQQVSRRVTLDVSLLPCQRDLLTYLEGERTRGRRLVLATAAHEIMARRVAAHLELFDTVLASSRAINLSGRCKRDRLVTEFGEKGYDYAGNGRRDLIVWSSCRKAILVNSSSRLSRMAARIAEIEHVFSRQEGELMSYLQAVRLHQWPKNLLVFVPLVMAHRFAEPGLLVRAFLAFLAFGLCASAVYLLNDLADLSADRLHPRKRERPFAAGKLSLFWGLTSIPLLIGLSFGVALFLPLPFLGMLAIYSLLNLAYSFYLKRLVLLDVMVLTGLYTLRVMAGSASVMIWPSSWLLAFSTFLFLSLALVKRYAELVVIERESGAVQVRGYQVIDKGLLASFGSGSGYVAVLVLVIYISSGVAEVHYSRHHLVWLLCPLLLYWISYVWLTAHRGRMHDDPLVFTARDWGSRIVILLGAAILALAM